jgi:hypothetical protein
MFCDLDFPAGQCVTRDILLAAARALQDAARPYARGAVEIVVTGAEVGADPPNPRVGVHLHAPAALVSPEQAARLRVALVQLLSVSGGTDATAAPWRWGDVVDSGVYSAERGLRLLGSRKISKGVDVGRVYELVGVVADSQEWDLQAASRYAEDPARVRAAGCVLWDGIVT